MNKLFFSLCIFIVAVMVFPLNSRAQLLNKLGQKTQQKLDKSVDNQIDKTLNNPQKKEESATQSSQSTDSPNAENKINESEHANNETTGFAKNEDYVSSYTSKFDFVPGEKVIISDDFSQDAIGDFPAKWYTDGSGEVVSIDGKEGKWLMLKENANFYLDQLMQLPDNFTIQFDLMCSVPFSWSSGIIYFLLEDIIDLERYRRRDNGSEASSNNINNSFKLDVHPGLYNPGTYNSKGYGHFKIVQTGGNIDLKEFFMPSAEKNLLHVSIWRQKQRLRVYLNENKILDLPKIIPPDMNPNLFVFQTTALLEGDNYFISNLRISVGNPDTRNKLLTDGKLVTSGILFSVNSAEIKPESYGVLKEIAGILSENKDIKVKIVGHTDSDGDEALNLELSKKRAEAVRNLLARNFSIDPGRMDADGKGEQEPLGPNVDAIAKANNRRVEFLKIN